MKKLALILTIASFCLSGFRSAAQQDLGDLVTKGIALHDRGDYEGAIRFYNEVLARDSQHVLAMYEKSYSLLLLKKYEECINLCAYITAHFPNDENVLNAYVNWGSALDYQGKPTAALKIYDKALKAFPGYYMLLFNKGITYIGMEKSEEAIAAIKEALRNNPRHASSHNVLGMLMKSRNKVASLLSSLAFLALQPYHAERAGYNREQVELILGANVSRKGEKDIMISLPAPSSKKKAEDDFGLVEMTMSLSSALNGSENYKNETPVETMNRNLGAVFSTLATGLKGNKGFFWEFYAPFFAAMGDERRLTFSHLIYATSGNVLNEVWLQDNQPKVEAFKEWVYAYQWPGKR